MAASEVSGNGSNPMEQFLETVFEPGGMPLSEYGAISLWHLPTKRSRMCLSPHDAARDAQIPAAANVTYFGVCLRNPAAVRRAEAQQRAEGKENVSVRGNSGMCAGIPGIWIDVDVMAGAHQKQSLPPHNAAAMAVIGEAIPVPPSVVVETGGGLHLYWLFKAVELLTNDEDRARFELLCAQYQQMLRDVFAARGWELDSTWDLARVLRLPGSQNVKYDPPRSVAWRGGGKNNSVPRYDPDELESYVPRGLTLAPERARNKPARSGSRDGLERATFDVSQPLLPGRVAELEEMIHAALDADPEFAARWNRRGPKMADSSQSAYDLSIATRLAVAGWDDQSVVDAMRLHRSRNPNAHQAKLNRADYYLSRMRLAHEARDEAAAERRAIEEVQAANAEARAQQHLAVAHGFDPQEFDARASDVADGSAAADRDQRAPRGLVLLPGGDAAPGAGAEGAKGAAGPGGRVVTVEGSTVSASSGAQELDEESSDPSALVIAGDSGENSGEDPGARIPRAVIQVAQHRDRPAQDKETIDRLILAVNTALKLPDHARILQVIRRRSAMGQDTYVIRFPGPGGTVGQDIANGTTLKGIPGRLNDSDAALRAAVYEATGYVVAPLKRAKWGPIAEALWRAAVDDGEGTEIVQYAVALATWIGRHAERLALPQVRSAEWHGSIEDRSPLALWRGARDTTDIGVLFLRTAWLGAVWSDPSVTAKNAPDLLRLLLSVEGGPRGARARVVGFTARSGADTTRGGYVFVPSVDLTRWSDTAGAAVAAAFARSEDGGRGETRRGLPGA